MKGKIIVVGNICKECGSPMIGNHCDKCFQKWLQKELEKYFDDKLAGGK